MQVAPQHAKAVGERARDGVEEGFFLDGIALDAAYIAPWNVELAALVVADFANPGLPFGNRAGMSTGVAAQAVAVELLNQLGRGLADMPVQDVFKGGHLSEDSTAVRCRKSGTKILRSDYPALEK